MRVLVVEDEPIIAAQLAESLGAAGYAVDVANNGIDAHYFGDDASRVFDAVILDLGLPQMDGLTVLRKWRAAGRKMPVLILTARDNWHEKVAGIDAGADDSLGAPVASIPRPAVSWSRWVVSCAVNCCATCCWNNPPSAQPATAIATAIPASVPTSRRTRREARTG